MRYLRSARTQGVRDYHLWCRSKSSRRVEPCTPALSHTAKQSPKPTDASEHPYGEVSKERYKVL